MNEQCPRCWSFQTVSGKYYLSEDIKGLLVGGILTLGLVLLYFIPHMAIRAASGTYNPAYHYCYNCGNKWTI